MSFREEIEKGLGAVVILAGSDSDEPHIDKLAGALEKYGIPYEVRIASAHKQTATLQSIMESYETLKGPLLFVAVAGGTDALSGIGSWRPYRPLISSPPDAPNQSCLTNPPGSSNSYIARPENVARFAAQMFAYANPACKKALVDENDAKVAKLVKKDGEFRERYAKRQADKKVAGEKK